jgi:aryl-alcohol dehydrogenase-like predicted oxidoreductase
LTLLDVLAWSAPHATGAIVYSPMASGLLSGSFTAARAAALDEDDWVRRHPDFTGDALARNLALAEALGPITSRHGVTVAAVAVAWTLAFPGVTGAIVGVRRAGQLDAWLSAASLALDDSDLTRIAEAIERTGAGSGPAQPALPT